MTRKKDPLFERIRSRETVYRGCYLKVERLSVDFGSGKHGVREVVRVKNAVAVLPVDALGNVVLVRQHRPAIGKTILEVPAGVVDGAESLAACACRECEEETGRVPRKLTKLITYAHAEGYSTGFITLFLGQNLIDTGKLKLDATEFVEPVSMPYKKLLGLIEKGRFVDSKTILSAILSRPYLEGRLPLIQRRRS
jgi:ADP-ribose pyrophosphatase